jgi:hypothetical protein
LAVIKKQEKAKALSVTTLPRLTDPESKFEVEGEFFGLHVLTVVFIVKKYGSNVSRLVILGGTPLERNSNTKSHRQRVDRGEYTSRKVRVSYQTL